jgi:hypothetical protein
MSETNTVSPLRQHMIEDMAARKLNPHTQRSHIHSCKRSGATGRNASPAPLTSGQRVCLRPHVRMAATIGPRSRPLAVSTYSARGGLIE